VADFCKECSEHLFGADYGDLMSLCAADECILVICDECGVGHVDVDGRMLRSSGLDKEIDTGTIGSLLRRWPGEYD
jgi:hypothetical protein